MELIETWRAAAVCEGFANGRSLSEISEETGLSIREVLQREVELKLIPAYAAALLAPMPEESVGEKPHAK